MMSRFLASEGDVKSVKGGNKKFHLNLSVYLRMNQEIKVFGAVTEKNIKINQSF